MKYLEEVGEGKELYEVDVVEILELLLFVQSKIQIEDCIKKKRLLKLSKF